MNKSLAHLLICSLVASVLLSGCGGGASFPAAEAGTQDADMQAFLKDNKLYKKAQKTASGIYYVMEKEGEGANPTLEDQVTVHYHGMLLNGKVFDSSVDRGEPATFPLRGVVKGWQEAVPLLKPGGKGKFIIPSALAYGERGAGADIPPNSPLVFDIELFSPEEAEKLKAEAAKKAQAAALEQATKDDVLIKNHLAKLNIDAKSTSSGIYYTMEKEGKGANPTATSKVEVHYHGTLLDGTVFDSSVDRGKTIEFGLNQVVKGWQEAIPLLKPGGKGTFYIPSGLCYGPNPRPGGKIPPNAVLIFDVELFKVK